MALKSYAARCDYEVVRNFKEVGSGAKLERVERPKVMEIARCREIDIILVSELTRWGRSTIYLIDSLHQLQSDLSSLDPYMPANHRAC